MQATSFYARTHPNTNAATTMTATRERPRMTTPGLSSTTGKMNPFSGVWIKFLLFCFDGSNGQLALPTDFSVLLGSEDEEAMKADSYVLPARPLVHSTPAARRVLIVDFTEQAVDAEAVQTTADKQIEEACQQVNEIVVALESVHPAWTEQQLSRD